MAFGDDHTVWLEVMKHLKSNLDLYMVSQCNKKLNGIANQHAVHVLKVRNHSKIDVKDELTNDEVCPELSPILKLMKEEIFQRKNSLDSFRFWYKVWQ